MTYEEFKYVVVSRIKEYLPEKYSQASISIDSVLKNNGQKLESISIRLKALKLCPTIYLEEYYHQFHYTITLELLKSWSNSQLFAVLFHLFIYSFNPFNSLTSAICDYLSMSAIHLQRHRG